MSTRRGILNTISEEQGYSRAQMGLVPCVTNTCHCSDQSRSHKLLHLDNHLMFIFRQDFGTLITRPSTFRLIYLPLATHRSATNIRISLSSERVSLDMTANETASTYYIQSGSLLGRSFATAYMGAKLDDLTISFSDAVNGLKQTY